MVGRVIFDTPFALDRMREILELRFKEVIGCLATVLLDKVLSAEIYFIEALST